MEVDSGKLSNFIGKYLLIQYDLFLHDILEKIDNMLKEGISFEDIKLEFNYLPNSVSFEQMSKNKQENAELLNKVIVSLLHLSNSEKYINLIGDDISVDIEEIKKALENDRNPKPKSSLIMLH